MNIEENKIKHPYKVSDAYLDNLEDLILSRVNLESIKQLNTAKTPKDYFEKLEIEILAKTISSESKIIKINWYQTRWAKAVAAALIFGTLSTLFYTNYKIKDKFEQISNDEMVDYLADQNVSESDLMISFNDSELKNIEFKQTISDKELLEYSAENEI